MIYLIDEKIKRQARYGWSYAKFLDYRETITLVSDYDQLKTITSQKMLEGDKNIIILFTFLF